LLALTPLTWNLLCWAVRRGAATSPWNDISTLQEGKQRKKEGS
jgi:hypothetical protein